MTKLQVISLWMLFAFFNGCALLGNLTGDEVINGPLFEEGQTGEGIQLAILELQGKNLNERHKILPSQIQGMISQNVRKYSQITLISKEELEEIQEKQKKEEEQIKKEIERIQEELKIQRENASALGFDATPFDDAIVMPVQTKIYYYILNGSITSTSEREIFLDLTITYGGTNEVLATYSTHLSIQDINAGEIGEASLMILESMGVVLTEDGAAAVKASAELSAEAYGKMARSQNAETFTARYVNAMGAFERDPTLIEAEEQLKKAQEEITTEKDDSELISDYQKRQEWLQNLKDFEEYFRDNPPFDIVLSNPQPRGIPNYDAGTADYEFFIGVQPSVELASMQKLLNFLLKELNKTKKRKDWKFHQWPERSLEYNLYQRRKFTVIVGLFDDMDREVTRTSVDLYTQLLVKFNKIIQFDAVQRVPVVMRDVRIASLTENMKLKLISIDNGVSRNDAAELEEKGAWKYRYVDVKRFPKGKFATIVKGDRTIIHPVPPAKPRKEIEPPDLKKYRIGTSFNVILNPRDGPDVSMSATIEGGYEIFAIEGIFGFTGRQDYYNSLYGSDDFLFNIGGGLGIAIPIGQYMLSSITAGVTYAPINGDGVAAPYLSCKFDILPSKAWLGFRAGLLMEFGGAGWGEYFDQYYKSALFNVDDGRMHIKFLFGAVFWL